MRPLVGPVTGPLVAPATHTFREGVGGGPWDATKVALQTFLAGTDGAANPHSQSAMPSPPTIVAEGGTRPAWATLALNADVTAAALLTNARYWGSEPLYSQGAFKPLTTDQGTTGGSLGFNDGREAVLARATFSVNARRMAFRVLRTTVPYRFIVDGRYADLTGTVPTNTTTSATHDYISLDFGSKAVREIAIEMQKVSGYVALYAEAGDTIAQVAAPTNRLFAAGDSFVYGTSATALGDGVIAVASDMLGIRDFWMAGTGGTGYVATSSGTKDKLASRLGGDLDRALQYGAIDIVVLAMGINDIGLSGLEAEANACIDIARTKCPAALIFVVGPWDQNAPSPPVANYAACKSAIQNAVGSRGGVWFLDPEGTAYSKADSLHGDTAGCATLGNWLNTEIRAKIAA